MRNLGPDRPFRQTLAPTRADLERVEAAEVGNEAIFEDERPGEIVTRPDGYHWIAPDGKQEFGPFETFEEACAYRDQLDEGAPSAEPDDLQEVEADIGIADWVDPDTGELAEGQCPPHLSDE